MAEYPKTVKLKDKKSVQLQLLVRDDVSRLAQFYKSIPESDRLFLRFDITDERNVQRRFSNLDYNHTYPIIAVNDNTIVGIATLDRAEFGWKRNLGEIRVVISPDFQRKGLATIFVREIFFHALKVKIYKIQAEMMETQESAIAAFEKLGFRKEATFRKQVTDIRNRRRDLIVMTLDIEDFWYLVEDYVEGKDFRIH
ncbi:MAG: GNAT family N-acetyltransferase [Candidatus Zhuqueibacterota bacterium]